MICERIGNVAMKQNRKEVLNMTSDKIVKQQEQQEGRVIFRAYIVKDGQRVYPRRAKAFRILLSH